MVLPTQSEGMGWMNKAIFQEMPAPVVECRQIAAAWTGTWRAKARSPPPASWPDLQRQLAARSPRLAALNRAPAAHGPPLQCGPLAKTHHISPRAGGADGEDQAAILKFELDRAKIVRVARC